MFDMDELDQNDLAHVIAILKREALRPTDIAYAGGGDIIANKVRFRWFKDEGDAEEAARDFLIEDDASLWRQAVAMGQTTDGLTVWADTLTKRRGWSGILSLYDDSERVAVLKDGTWFPYIRI